MGLDMHLSASRYVGGGWNHVRNQIIHDPAGKQPPRIVPKDPKPKEAAIFDDVLSRIGLGEFEDFHARYPEGNSLTVSVVVAYWRKANAVHRWFVEHVQGGTDDCKPYYVRRERLAELRDICVTILGTVDKGEPVIEKTVLGEEYRTYPNATLDVEVAKEALGTQSGFFFGSTKYDETYIEDLEYTVAQLTTILEDPRLDDEFDFTYRSSW